MNKKGKQRRLRIRAVRRNPPDLKKLSRALIELAQAQAEADAASEDAQRPKGREHSTSPPDADPPEAA